MELRTSQDIQDRAILALSELLEAPPTLKSPTGIFPKERIREQIAEEMKQKIESGEVVITTDEEMRLLREFRVFKDSCKPGAVFKWQTRPTVEGLVLRVEDTGLIRSLENVSD